MSTAKSYTAELHSFPGTYSDEDGNTRTDTLYACRVLLVKKEVGWTKPGRQFQDALEAAVALAERARSGADTSADLASAPERRERIGTFDLRPQMRMTQADVEEHERDREARNREMEARQAARLAEEEAARTARENTGNNRGRVAA